MSGLLRREPPNGYLVHEVTLTGETPLLMSSGEVDRSSELFREYRALSKARAKTLEQEAQLRELEWHTRISEILSGIARENKQVLFEGNGYSPEWHAEAERRGLLNNKTTVDALPALSTAKAKSIFAKFGVLSERELAARVEIGWERYVKVGNIEASTALDIAKTMILPAAVRHLGMLHGVGDASRSVAKMADHVGTMVDKLSEAIDELEHAVHEAHAARDIHDEARAFVNGVIPAQSKLRDVADELETVVADDLWPLPKYRELLFQY